MRKCFIDCIVNMFFCLLWILIIVNSVLNIGFKEELCKNILFYYRVDFICCKIFVLIKNCLVLFKGKIMVINWLSFIKY